MKLFSAVPAAVCFSLWLSTTVLASPSVNVSLDPEIPGFVPLGGLLVADCAVDPDGTTPDLFIVEVFDSADDRVVDVTLEGAISYHLEYSPGFDAPPGIYRYQVTYSSEEGDQAVAEGRFLVAGESTLCALKFIDNNENGEFDAGDELGIGWEFCVTGTQDLGCQTTGGDGIVCWFDVEDGVYEVCETAQDGFESTTGGLCQEIGVDDDVWILQFGNKEVDLPPIPTLETSWGEVKSIYR